MTTTPATRYTVRLRDGFYVVHDSEDGSDWENYLRESAAQALADKWNQEEARASTAGHA